MQKLSRYLMVLAAAASFGLLPSAQAAGPLIHPEAPGYSRMPLGHFVGTALFDGVLDLDKQLLQNIPPAVLAEMLGRMFVGNPKMQTSVNAFLINTGTHLVLVDTGAAKLFGPSLGNMLQNLKAAGYQPDQVDMILITHLHGDHVGGITDAAGKPVFPKATIYTAQAESDFWLSQQNADAAPKERQRTFQMARASAAPYQASGQWKTFSGNVELAPGIKAIDTHGHTPGHTVYAVESDGQKLLLWGDLLHAHAVQFARPGVAMVFDNDQKQAIAARRNILQLAAKEKALVAGAHLPFPGIGHIRADGKGSYSWVPIEFTPMPEKK
jgi:glyoxylase-like metal-dependent hydrolase (beta-lactamase superfamily II)